MVSDRILASIKWGIPIFTLLYLQTMTSMAFIQIPPPLLHLQKDLGIPATPSSWNLAKESFSPFARQLGQERWQLKALDLKASQLNKVNSDLAELGFINAIPPIRKHYQVAVVTGGAVPRMILRIKYLISLWQQGVRFDKVILIAGQRPLADFDNLINEMALLQAAMYGTKL